MVFAVVTVKFHDFLQLQLQFFLFLKTDRTSAEVQIQKLKIASVKGIDNEGKTSLLLTFIKGTAIAVESTKIPTSKSIMFGTIPGGEQLLQELIYNKLCK